MQIRAAEKRTPRSSKFKHNKLFGNYLSLLADQELAPLRIYIGKTISPYKFP